MNGDAKKPKSIVSTLRRLPQELVIPGDGEKARLLGTAVMEYHCLVCLAIWWMKSCQGDLCPSCGERVSGGKVESRWTAPQTIFIPELETKIMSNGEKK